MQSDPQQGQQQRAGPPQPPPGQVKALMCSGDTRPPPHYRKGWQGHCEALWSVQNRKSQAGWARFQDVPPTSGATSPPNPPAHPVHLGAGAVQVSMRGGTEGQRGLTDGEPWRDTYTDPEPRGSTSVTAAHLPGRHQAGVGDRPRPARGASQIKPRLTGHWAPGPKHRGPAWAGQQLKS